MDNELRNTDAAQPLWIPTAAQGSSSTEPLSPRLQRAASDAAANMFDELVAKSVEKDSSVPATALAGVSHPSIFRKGTLIEIPDSPQRAQQRRKDKDHRAPVSALKPRLVAICIKDDVQAKYVIDWVAQNELVIGRDRIVLLHVRQAINGIIGDLTLTNSAKEDAEREKSHGLLRRHAGVLKQEGFDIKGVSIRGVDIRGELVRKLVELKCDLLVIGNSSSKSIKDRLIGCKVSYLTSNSPCPVLVIGSDNAQRGIQDTMATSTEGAGVATAAAALNI
ncbi:hypothetical protein GGI04_000868 [Coemansia thaxteri]|uniref:UspA domain-containing protein n=1 Tax=Coemansia thaxteri TaxID=2663907 RepID=A0A9W8BG54_9FUNG|nr:hypothetical protein H4R26_004491 [Coemansia thaxteri]KAJ2008934.1 hypothetical protein GGI04_000868 [Coemansia thaxteri]KAJ2473556.1 hypothetical protein GGI02_000776 [Coemansia sp. RSA 2322]KAJ2485837.1 hypothetical protein EV174_001492 [Coemansia sp. RSA 2320]